MVLNFFICINIYFNLFIFNALDCLVKTIGRVVRSVE